VLHLFTNNTQPSPAYVILSLRNVGLRSCTQVKTVSYYCTTTLERASFNGNNVATTTQSNEWMMKFYESIGTPIVSSTL
jgi:hypothetical protein